LNGKEKYCKRIEFKDKTKRPVLGIILKEDDNYIHFETKKGVYRFSHDAIDTIGDTDIIFEGGDKNAEQ
jgi:hypothetical protein